MEWFLNLNALRFDESITETPNVGTIEDWVYINMTGDTHPMHSHLVTFQVVGRTPFDAEALRKPTAGRTASPVESIRLRLRRDRCSRPIRQSAASRIRAANPGEFTTIRAQYDLPTGVTAPQTYVYHCHIVEHEDNDMMRAFTVVP